MATQPKNWTLHGIMLTEPEPAAPGHKRMTKDWWLVQGEKTVLQKEEGFNIDVGDNLMFFFLRPKKEGLHEGKALIRIKFRRHVGREHRDESPLSAEDTAKLKYKALQKWNLIQLTGVPARHPAAASQVSAAHLERASTISMQMGTTSTLTTEPGELGEAIVW